MPRFKIIFIFFVLVIASSISVIIYYRSGFKPDKNLSVKVVINQSSDYVLSLKSFEKVKSKYSDYKLEIPFGYYNIHIYDGKQEVLFTGKVAKDKVSFPPYEILPEEKESTGERIITEPLKEIILFLPSYRNAKKIVFTDEKNQVKLVIDL